MLLLVLVLHLIILHLLHNLKNPATIALSINVPDSLVSLPIKIVVHMVLCVLIIHMLPDFATLYMISGVNSVLAILLIPSVPKYFLS